MPENTQRPQPEHDEGPQDDGPEPEDIMPRNYPHANLRLTPLEAYVLKLVLTPKDIDPLLTNEESASKTRILNKLEYILKNPEQA